MSFTFSSLDQFNMHFYLQVRLSFFSCQEICPSRIVTHSLTLSPSTHINNYMHTYSSIFYSSFQCNISSTIESFLSFHNFHKIMSSNNLFMLFVVFSSLLLLFVFISFRSLNKRRSNILRVFLVKNNNQRQNNHRTRSISC
jgi:hypothetical protein